MSARVLILSEDTLFARMLELEFQMQALETVTSPEWGHYEDADVILLDLDSVPPPGAKEDVYIIGFTRSFAISEMDPERRCSMILHRPFEIRALREEVLTLLLTEDHSGRREIDRRRTACRLEGDCLVYGKSRVPLSPHERELVACLLSHRGVPVSRAELGRVIGESTANKVDVYICYLRRKLEHVTDKPLILTVRGKGYQIR